jgi:hypothetical protein
MIGIKHLRFVSSPAVSVSAIFSAIATLCAAVGVWTMRAWTPLAVLVWGVGALILGGAFVVQGPRMVDAPLNSFAFASAGLGVIAAAIVAAMWLYVRRKLAHVDL